MRRPNIALIGGIVLAVVAAALIVVGLKDANRTETIWVADTYVPARKLITKTVVAKESVSPSSVPPDSILAYGDIVGRYTLESIYPGQTFVVGAVANNLNETGVLTDGLGPGDRAFAISANVAQALAGRIVPGDKVDVVAVVTDSSSSGAITTNSSPSASAAQGPVATTVVQQATVLDVSLAASTIQSAGSTGAPNPAAVAEKGATVPGIYTLALTEKQVEEVALAEGVGTLYLALDPVSGASTYTGGPVGMAALGATSIAPKVGGVAPVAQGAGRPAPDSASTKKG
ncbi:MAG: Flp pilus assembly protein CpaB [Actinomycetota bacterium]|jgi:Flp pilus assembly protein CpaB|nr:Flp pilus assembly protein CpaB [Actinomycetota bacterium]